jgi:hypothetical protein
MHPIPRQASTSGRTRREFLERAGGGFGGLALAALLGDDGLLAADSAAQRHVRPDGGLHHRPRARRVIQLFMNGGVSQCDTFDYKPELERRHGQSFAGGPRAAATSVPGALMKSPFAWQRHGECGRWVSSVFPELARRVDELAFLMAMSAPTNVHGPASYFSNTGSLLPGFPCMGAWLTYGLGRLADELPAFVVLPDARGLPYNNRGNFSAGFLPASQQGTLIQLAQPVPIHGLRPPPGAHGIDGASEAAGQALVARLNRRHLESFPGDDRLEARIAAYELAARMQLSAPEALDLGAESEATRRLYGIDQPASEDFGRRCLLARRLIERGVRFVQVWSGAGGASGNWDNHTNIEKELPAIARQVDRPIAGLLADLKARGLVEDTLVIWTSEFGRMPFSQASTGRDHNGGTYVSWLAGAGVRGGAASGESDEVSYRGAVNVATAHDLQATALHLLGIDHTRLTVRHNGAERRLTDVHGRVIEEILA